MKKALPIIFFLTNMNISYCQNFNKEIKLYSLETLDTMKACLSIEAGLKDPKSIIKLNLMYKLLTNIHRLPEFENLQYIEFYYHNLNSIPKEIYGLSKLQVLKLGSNHIESISDQINKLTNLKKISLEWNELNKIPLELFNSTNLEILELNSNDLFEIPEDILRLKKLKSINIAFNDKLDYKKTFALIAKLSNLEELYIGVSSFEKLPEEILLMDKLKKVGLYGSIGSFDLAHSLIKLGKLSYIEELWLPYHMKKLPKEIGLLVSLKKLHITQSKIKKLPPEIGNLKNLKVLDLSTASLSEWPDELYKLIELERIECMWCKISKIKAEICNLKKLKYLNIHGANVNHLPECMGQLNNIEELHLRYNKLNKLPLNIKGWKNLKLLDIQDNKFDQNEIERVKNNLPNTEIKLYSRKITKDDIKYLENELNKLMKDSVIVK